MTRIILESLTNEVMNGYFWIIQGVASYLVLNKQFGVIMESVNMVFDDYLSSLWKEVIQMVIKMKENMGNQRILRRSRISTSDSWLGMLGGIYEGQNTRGKKINFRDNQRLTLKNFVMNYG